MAIQINKQTIILTVVISFIITLIGVFTVNPKQFNESRINIFIKFIPLLVFALVSMGLVLTAQALEDGKELNKIDQTWTIIDRCLMKQYNAMQEQYRECPNFIRSLFPQQGLFQQKPSKTEDNEASIIYLSMLLFQSFEEHFVNTKTDIENEYVWVRNYLQWCSSPKFYNMWTLLRSNLKDITNSYIELLFDYAMQYPITDPQDLETQAIEFVKNPRFHRILKFL